jgi:hydroxymethylpyrimidine/phosphomethylpyrimidine kinase
MRAMTPRVLVVAGSDSGGGAGIQADIKTITALGAYAATAITALTAQSTLGVFGVVPVEPSFIAKQMEVVLADIGADAVKTGMLHSADVIDAVASTYARLGGGAPLVVDPVMIAKGGAPLLEPAATTALSERLLPLASVLTPNLPEAEVLLGRGIPDADAMRDAAAELLERGPRAVLLKGGHLAGDRVVDVLAARGRATRVFEGTRVQTRSTHGTGCTLASALAAHLAAGRALEDAIEGARAYVLEALRTAPGLGRGHGPLRHWHTLR